MDMHCRLFVVTALLLAGSRAQDLVGVAWTGEVYRISTATGAATQFGTTLFTSGQNSMAIDPGGKIWSTQGVGLPPIMSLMTIDPVTGVGTVRTGPLAGTPDVRGLAAEADGTFFAVVNNRAAFTCDLWRIFPNGSAFRIGDTGFSALQGLTSVGGALYGFDVNSGLVRIDRVTGAAVDVNPAIGGPPNAAINFLATRADGKVFGGHLGLYEVDLVTGAYTPIGTGGWAAEVRGADFPPLPCALGYGAGCRGSGGRAPELYTPACFRGGSTAQLRVERGLGAAPGVLLIGQSQASVPFLGCNLLVGNLYPVTLPLLLGGTGAGNGTWSQGFALPAGPTATLTFQVGLLDAGASLGLAATNGLWVVTQ